MDSSPGELSSAPTRRRTQGLPDIFSLEVGIRGQDLVRGHLVGHHADDRRHGNAQAADAGDPSHPCRVDGIRVNVIVGTLLPGSTRSRRAFPAGRVRTSRRTLLEPRSLGGLGGQRGSR